jgi:hypothetical protein
MVLERFLMKLFTPRRLAERDTDRVLNHIGTSVSRCQQGCWIAMATGIPERDLDYLLGLMEKAGLIERDPGPFDQPATRNRLLSWWAPGPDWHTVAKFHGGPK